jgi:hypothetical protein
MNLEYPRPKGPVGSDRSPLTTTKELQAMKKFSINLDALIVVCVLFLISMIGNIFVAQVNRDMGDQLLEVHSQLAITQLQLATTKREKAECERSQQGQSSTPKTTISSRH